MQNIHFLNGKFVSEEELLISPRDLGYTRGYAVFDFLRTYNGKPFHLSEHIERLLNSAKLIDLKIPYTKQEIEKLVLETLAKNNKDTEKAIKIIASGGISSKMTQVGSPTFMIWIDDLALVPQEYYENGVGIITVKYKRYMPEAKTNNYIEGVKQTQIAESVGAIEPVYFDDEGLYESSNSNLFIIKDGKIYTQKENMLLGITRKVLLEILKPEFIVEEKNLKIEDLLGADEAFLTGSAKEILPIVKIDGKIFSLGVVGENTKKILEIWKKYTNKY